MLKEFVKELIGSKANIFLLVGISYLVTDQVFLRNRVTDLENNLSDCDSAYKKFLFENTQAQLQQNTNSTTLKHNNPVILFIKPKEFHLE